MVVAGEGFPRSCRLLTPSDYRKVFSSNHRSADSQFLVLARRNGLNRARLGLAISKQKVRTAVGRNRVKRLIRESFRKHQGELAGLDIVVVAQRGIALSDNNRLTESLSRHWERISK